MHVSRLVAALACALGGAIAVAFPAANPTACNADNCLRQVRASAFTTRTGSADCATYTSTSIVTTTVAAAAKRDSHLHDDIVPRAAAPNTIPAYASSCGSPSQYASACSCNGSPVKTTTSTTTVYSTSIPANPCPTGTFAVQYQNSGREAYATLEGGSSPQGYAVVFNLGPQSPPLADAARFQFVRDLTNAGQCRLSAVAFPGTLSSAFDSPGIFSPGFHNFYLAEPGANPNSKVSPIYCMKDAANLLSCRAVDAEGQAPDQTALDNFNGDRLVIGSGSTDFRTRFALISV